MTKIPRNFLSILLLLGLFVPVAFAEASMIRPEPRLRFHAKTDADVERVENVHSVFANTLTIIAVLTMGRSLSTVSPSNQSIFPPLWFLISCLAYTAGETAYLAPISPLLQQEIADSLWNEYKTTQLKFKPIQDPEPFFSLTQKHCSEEPTEEHFNFCIFKIIHHIHANSHRSMIENTSYRALSVPPYHTTVLNQSIPMDHAQGETFYLAHMINNQCIMIAQPTFVQRQSTTLFATSRDGGQTMASWGSVNETGSIFLWHPESTEYLP